MRSPNLLVDGCAKPLTINCVLCVKKEAEPLVLHPRLTSYIKKITKQLSFLFIAYVPYFSNSVLF